MLSVMLCHCSSGVLAQDRGWAVWSHLLCKAVLQKFLGSTRAQAWLAWRAVDLDATGDEEQHLQFIIVIYCH